MKNKGKYQKQLRVVFLSIAASFIFVVMGLTSYNLTKSLKQTYQNTIYQTINSENMLAEVCFSTLHSVTSRLLQSEAIQTWAAAEIRSSFYYNAIGVRDEMHDLVSTFSAIPLYPAVTTLDEDVFVIDSTGTISKQEYFMEQTDLSAEQLQQIFSHFQSNSGEIIIPAYDELGILKDLYFIMRKPYAQNGVLYFIRLPRTSLLGSNISQEFIIYNGVDVIAYSHNNDNNIKKMNRIFDIIKTLDKDSFQPNIPTAMDGFDVYLSEFSNSKWKIAYVYNTHSFSPTGIAAYILLPFLMLCVLLYVIFHFLTNWLYKPIQATITELAPDGHQHGKPIDEFLLLRQNAVAAKELANRLQSVVSENTSLLSQRFYRDILLGINVTKNPIYKNFSPEINSCSVALFHFDDGKDNEESLSNDIFFSKNVLFAFTQQNNQFHAVNISHTDCAVILETRSIEESRKILQAAIKELPEKQNYQIALSRIRSGIHSVHTSYLEACNIMEYKYLYISSNILTADQVLLHQTDNYYYPIILENKMIQYLAEGKEKTLEIYDNLIRENFSHREFSPETLHSFIFALLGTINRAFQELKSNPTDLLGETINFEEYYANWNHPNIISSIRKMLEQMLLAIQTKNNQSDSTTLDAMRNYIYENYSTDMTLNDMADAIGISAKYCSNLFKKLSNDTFKNFLNSYRIDQAKKLLEENPDIKIAELSKQVGFNSSNTFIRVFGKYTGMTPGAYSAAVHNK